MGTPREVWRAASIVQLAAVASLCVFVTLAGWLIYAASDRFSSWVGAAVFVFAGILTGGMARRSCVLDDENLLAKGRLATRRVELSDLRQAGASPLGHVWIQAHHPLDKRGRDILYLRMIPTAKNSVWGTPGGDRAAALIRARATSAGAVLDPPLVRPRGAPTRKPLFFSS